MHGVVGLLVAVVVSQTDVPVYLDAVPPVPFIAVNSTWNTSMLEPSDATVPLPTGQWWADLVDPTGNSAPVNALPLLVKQNPCGFLLSAPVTTTTNVGRRVATEFTQDIKLDVNIDATAERCQTRVVEWGDFHVRSLHTIINGPQTDAGLESVLTRGSPFLAFRTVNNALASLTFTGEITRISKLPVSTTFEVHASILNVTTSSGKRWLVILPEVTRMEVSTTVIRLLDPVVGWIKIANVPEGPSHGEASRYLIEHSECVPYGGTMGASYNATGDTVSANITWNTAPGTSCMPLILTAANHRSKWKGGWPAGWNDETANPLQYMTVMGVLMPPVVETANFEMEFPVSKQLLSTDAAAFEDTCEEFWLHSMALLDDEYLLGDVKAASNNASGYEETLPVKAEEFYGLAVLYRIARRLKAVKMGLRLQTRMFELMATIVQLTVYDETWKGVVVSQPGRLASEVVSDNYENNTAVYGMVLYGFAELYGVPPGGLETAPAIPDSFFVFINALLRTIMMSGESNYYTPIRNFDWYTASSFSGGIVSREEGRAYSAPSYSLLAWLGAKKTADILGIANASSLATILLTMETDSAVNHWLSSAQNNPFQAHVGVFGSGVVGKTAVSVEAADTLSVFSPLGEHLVGMRSSLGDIAAGIQNVMTLLETDPNNLRSLASNSFDVSLLALHNGSKALELLDAKLPMNFTILNPMTSAVEWGLLTNTLGNCVVFPSWTGSIPLRTVGRQIWYKDSFNYQLKVMEYVPAVVARKPSETNVYGEFYDPLFDRDLPRIRDMGFNTLKVTWFGLNLYGLQHFVSYAAKQNLDVMITFTATQDQVLNNRHIAEQKLFDCMDILGKYENVILWNLESNSFGSITIDSAYNYLTLFRQLRRIRDKKDERKRPIVLSLPEFGMTQLITGGTAPVDIYKDGVELVELTLLEVNVTSMTQILGGITHPLFVRLQTDSFNSIKIRQDQPYRASLLSNQTNLLLDYYRTHDMCGLEISEWVDQYWRGATSHNDNDCPDPSPGRHSTCSIRVIEFIDGELNLEHIGINYQRETWFKHCIGPKKEYFTLASILTGVDNPDVFESCLFLFLEDQWQKAIFFTTVICLFLGTVFCCAAMLHRRNVKVRAETRGAQAGTRWLQPDIGKLSRIIVKRTCTLPHTQKPFERIAIQSEPGLAADREIAPLSGEWEGEVTWFDQEARELGLFLQFSALPNNTGFNITGQDTGGKYKLTGTARKFEEVSFPTLKENGESLLTSRYLIDFVARNMQLDDDEDEEDLEFVGVWEKWKSAPDDEGKTMLTEVIFGGEEAVPGFQTGCKVASDGMYTGAFELTPQPEVDPWCYNRWQCVRMQLERLQMLIYDEMLCQGRWGTEAKHQETDAAFEWAVSTLHYRYLHSFHGWCNAQKTIGGILDVAEEGQEKRTDEQLTELLGLFTIWQLGEHLTLFSGHWLSWNLHYFLKFKRFPPTHVLNDGRHFMETPLTFDDINESCALMPYYDIPHICSRKCPEVCSIALEERGQRQMPKLLLPDGNPDTSETKRFPFRKTFREPRKWGVIFLMLHDAFFVIHTTAMLFVFWALVVFFSTDKNRDLQAVMERSYDVWRSSSQMHFILLVMVKMDFWLVVTHELLDAWLSSGLTQFPFISVICTRLFGAIGFMFCKCRCCCSKVKAKQQADTREVTCQTFWTDTTCRRVRFWSFFKLRFSGYVTMITFLVIFVLGDIVGYEDAGSNRRIFMYLVIRLSSLFAFNIYITVFPHKLHGAPASTSTVNTWALGISIIFWTLIYCVAAVFQAWIMYRTEGTGFSFCDCDGLKTGIEDEGASDFFYELSSKIGKCGEEQPRCFVAVFMIWFSTGGMFAISVQGGFLIGVILLGGIKHLLIQWKSRKSRQIHGHKMETKFILSAINVKLLSFTDPRDNNLARKVWNKVIQVMHEEDILTSYEYETLLIHPHVADITFKIDNSFAKERLSGFLEYLQSSTHFEESLGPVQCYPSASVIVPVYGEGILADRRLLRLKARGDHQQQSQLHFLVEHYHDEWLNFVERCVTDYQLFREALLEEQVVAYLQDKQTLVEEFDYIKKRALKPDNRLREICGMRVCELFHTRPKLFSEEEFDAIWWWASMRMQTVARTVRGIERNREAVRFLLELEAEYTQSSIITATYVEMMSSDKLQVIIALQRMANNKWYDANKRALSTTWRRFPKMQVVFDVETGDYRMSPEVYQKTTFVMQDLWDCMEYASCLALWDVATEDWFVNQVIGRRLPLRMSKQDKVKWSLPGPMQGKSVNQAHCLPFCKGQVIQTVDCNQDGYFEESLKLRTLLGKFFPKENRKWCPYKVVGHPEYVITMKSGTVGRYAGYAEYIFNTLFQRVLSVLGVRMHYGHPDYFDSSWVVTQSGLSKPNPRVNLNEDIFAGYHIKASGESTIHLEDVKSGKGRETNFDGAMGFEAKLGMGAAMQYRSRDFFELTRYSNVFERHSIFFGSIGVYVYLGLIFIQIFSTIILQIALTLAGKTDYELQRDGSPYGSEWMVQMTLLEGAPLGVQLILDYGVWGLFQWLIDFTGVTSFFLFVTLTKYHYFWSSVFNGAGLYVATGRMDPLFRRSFRHMWRLYSHTHFMYGSLLLAIIVLYMDLHPRPSGQSFLRTFFHWGVAIGWMVTPCMFNPSLSVAGITKDLLRFFSWVWGDAIQQIKSKKDPILPMSPGGKENSPGGKGVEKKRMAELFNAMVKKNRDIQGPNTAGSPKIGHPHSSKPTTTSGAVTGRQALTDDSSSVESTKITDSDTEPHVPLQSNRITLPGDDDDEYDSDQEDYNVVFPKVNETDAPLAPQKVTVERQEGLWKPSTEPTFVEYEHVEGSPGGSAPKTARAGANFAELHNIEDKQTSRSVPTARMKKQEDDLLSDSELNEDHFLNRGVSSHLMQTLKEVFRKLDIRGGMRGLIGPDLIFMGLLSRGIRVDISEIEEYMNALSINQATYEEFVLIYFMVEGKSAQLESYGLKHAMDYLPSEKLDQIAKQDGDFRGRRNTQYNSRDAQAEAYIQFAYALRRSRAVREVEFYDSTHNLERDKTESLLHHYKVSIILEYRGTSSMGRFCFSILNMAIWLFVFFSLWQDIMWEVLFLLFLFTWDYILCLTDVVPVVILTRVVVYLVMFIRVVEMLGNSATFFPTIFMVYWFVHLVLGMKFSFWACFGPYLLGRDCFNSPKIDHQREKSLLMLLKDRREQYLFAFAYYIFCRRSLAMIIVLFQYFFCLILLLIRALIDLILWLIWNVGKYFARKNATQTTYIASRSKNEEQEAKKGRIHFDMIMQTEDGGRGLGTHMWGEEKGTQIYMPNGDDVNDMLLSPPDYETMAMPNFGPLPDMLDPEQWPAEWLNLGFPNGKPADWVRLALNGQLPPAEWLKIAHGEGDLPAEWLNVVPPDNELWPEEPPIGWPKKLPWPPPRIGHTKEPDLDAEWLKLLLAGDDLNPDYIKLAIKNQLPAAEWLKIALDKDEIPAEWLGIVPPPGGLWPEEPPINWPKNAPWPPPAPKKGPKEDLPAEWLKIMVKDKKFADAMKNMKLDGLPPAEWLKIAAGGGDIPAEWLNILPKDGGTWGPTAPPNWPAHLQWPPPAPDKVPKDLPVEWLNVAFKNNAPPEDIKKIALGNMTPVEWLKIANKNKTPPAEWLNIAPPPGGLWPEQPPINWPKDMPWPPPQTKKGPNEDLPAEWLKLMANDEKFRDQLKNLKMGEAMPPAEWLRIAAGGDDIPEEWLNIIPKDGKTWGPTPPENWPAHLQWPPPAPDKVPHVDLPVEWLNVAFKNNASPDDIKKIALGDMTPAEWLKIAAKNGTPPAEWLSIVPPPGGDWPKEAPKGYPKDAPWPPPKPKGYKPDEEAVPVEWLRLAFQDEDLEPEMLQAAMDGNLDPAEWLRIAMNGDPPAELLKIIPQPDEDWPAERPALYPPTMPWPPPKPKANAKTKKRPQAEDDLEADWLRLAFENENAPTEKLKLAVKGELEPAEWLKLQFGDDLDPEWLKLDLNGEFPAERPSNYPANVPWPPPKPKATAHDPDDDIPVDWLKIAMDPPKPLPLGIQKKAMHGELEPAEWLQIGLDGRELDPEWLKLDSDGNYQKLRPRNYPQNLPWPPPAPVPLTRAKSMKARVAKEKKSTVPVEWLNIAFERYFERKINAPTMQKANRDELTSAEWLKIALDKDPPVEWLRTKPDGTFYNRPKGYPINLPWPPPKGVPTPARKKDDLPVEWLKVAFRPDVPNVQKMKVLKGELPPEEWLKLATGDDPQPHWLALDKNGEFPEQRPAGYPETAPWPPPMPNNYSPRVIDDEIPVEWVQIMFDKQKELGMTDEDLRRGLDSELSPAEWLKIALGRDPDPEWLKLGPDGNFPSQRPAGYPADALWPPPKSVGVQSNFNDIPVEWIKLAYDREKEGKLSSDGLRRMLTGEFGPRDWLKLALDNPDHHLPFEWLTLNPDGNYPEQRPAGYPATAPWPPPKPKNPDEDLAVEWLAVACKKGIADEQMDKARKGELAPAEWLKIGLDGKAPPPEWLQLQRTDGSWRPRPADYPSNLPWPPPKQEVKAKDDDLAVEWLRLLVSKGVDDETLRKAKNCELLPQEWLKIALNGADPPADWLKCQRPDGTFPPNKPLGYPAELPWPPPPYIKPAPKTQLAPPKKRTRGPSVAKKQQPKATVTVSAKEGDVDQEVPVEWLKLALDAPAPEMAQAAMHGDLPAAEWLKLATDKSEVEDAWLKLMPTKPGEKWPEQRPAGYPVDSPWPPPVPKVALQDKAEPSAPPMKKGLAVPARRKRGPSVGARHGPTLAVHAPGEDVGKNEEEDLEAVWINLAFAGNNDALDPQTQLRSALNNDLPPAEWLKVALGGKDPPKEWLDIIPKPGEDWPMNPPLGYPLGVPWPPPKPKADAKRKEEFTCEAWDDATAQQKEEDEDAWLVGIVPAVEGFAPDGDTEGYAALKQKPQGWSSKGGLEDFQDMLKAGDEGDEEVKPVAVPAPVETSYIFFKESGPGQKPVHFFDSDGFRSISEFRAAVRHFLKFRGPVEQVLLQMQRKGDFTDMEEIENHHQWPLFTTVQNPVIVTIYDLFQPRQRKQKMKVRGNQLKMRLGAVTDINRRSEQMKARRGDERDMGTYKGASLLGGRGGHLQVRAASPHLKPVSPGRSPARSPTGINLEASTTFMNRSPSTKPNEHTRRVSVARLKPPVLQNESSDSEHETTEGVHSKGFSQNYELPGVGITLEPMAQLGAGKVSGMKVAGVAAPALETGLRVGDVLLTVNNRAISSKSEFNDVLRNVKRDQKGQWEPLVLGINRAGAGGRATVLVKPSQGDGKGELPRMGTQAQLRMASKLYPSASTNQLPFGDSPTVSRGAGRAGPSLSGLGSLRRHSSSLGNIARQADRRASIQTLENVHITRVESPR